MQRFRLHRRLRLPDRRLGNQGQHLLVGWGDGLEVSDQASVRRRVLLVLGEARHLLIDLDRFCFLADGGKRPPEQTQGIQILRVRLEADLQLRQRVQAVLWLVAVQVELRRQARVLGILLEVEDALDDLERVITPAQPEQ